MKAVVLTGPKQLTVKDVPNPVSDGKRPIIRVESVGICGSDIHYWVDGEPMNLIMGHEFSGTVTDPGERKDLKVGDRVSCLGSAPCLECGPCKSGNSLLCENKGPSPGIISPDRIGAYTEYFMPLKSGYLYKLPDHLSFDEAAMVEPACVAYHTATLGGVTKGSKVLVTGAGLIGAMTMQWCKALGAEKVYFTEVNESRAKKVLEMGYADVWINEVPGAAELLDTFAAARPWEQEIASATQLQKLLGVGLGFDIALECSAHPSAYNLASPMLHNFATVVWAGVQFTPITIQMSTLIMRSTTIKVFLGTSVTDFETALKAIGDGSFPVKQYHTDNATLATTQQAFEKLTAPGNAQFKIIVHPQEG